VATANGEENQKTFQGLSYFFRTQSQEILPMLDVKENSEIWPLLSCACSQVEGGLLDKFSTSPTDKDNVNHGDDYESINVHTQRNELPTNKR